MSAVSIIVVSIVGAGLFAVAFGPDAAKLVRRRRDRGGSRPQLLREQLPDPGRELRAERRAEDLLRSVAGREAYEAYRALGFLHVYGGEGAAGRPSYGYLIYPHKPLVSYDVESGELLSELCVGFPDRTEGEFGERLPDADDVLAKWMALSADERGLVDAANMHLPGRQLDPDHVRRDVLRMSEWTSSATSSTYGSGDIA